MDAFKLLSRSTKLPRKPTGKAGRSNALPLLQQEELGKDQQGGGSKVSKKRKRIPQDAGSEDITLNPEIDFFGGYANAPDDKSSHVPVAGFESKDAHAESDEVSPEDDDDEELSINTVPPSHDERKRIFQSHKIKITKIWPREADLAQLEASKPKKRPPEENKSRDSNDTTKKIKKKLEILPVPLAAFSQLRPKYGIDSKLAKNIAAQRYVTPTEVQLAALPLLLDKDDDNFNIKQAQLVPGDLAADLMAIAPTGSGKTLAFLIPIINSIAHRKSSKAQANGNSDSAAVGPSAIILAPTKELAAQIVLEARKLSKGTGISVSRPRKGMALSKHVNARHDAQAASDSDEDDKEHEEDEDITQTKGPSRSFRRSWKSPDILVSAPLSLVKAITSSSEDINTLDSVRFLVLDEADVLLDPMFRAQTLQVWSACTYLDLRVSLWSATMASSIEALATSTVLGRRKELMDAKSSKGKHSNLGVPLVRLVIGLKDSAIPSSIDHRLTYCANEAGKLLAIRQLLRSPPPSSSSSSTSKPLNPPFLIFTQTIPRAIALASELKYDIPTPISALSITEKAAGQPHARIAVLHADLRPSARSGIMARFRSGEIWLLITTDLLARGVDFAGVNAVINYDLPNSSAAYVHRVGRTGRTVRNPHMTPDASRRESRRAGVAITFVAEEDMPYLRNVVNVIEGAERAARANSKADTNASVDDQDNGSSPTMSSTATIPSSVKQWMLTSLPKPTKREKQRLKKRGVEARRTVGLKDKAKASTSQDHAKALKNAFRTRISTKSGFDRRMEHRRKGAVRTTKMRKVAESED